MNILAIESSCDDTSVALLNFSDTQVKILAEKTASQIEIHKKYGGVVPEVAGRTHAENIIPLIEEIMEGQKKPDAIAVTAGPGLITGLIVGVEAAKTLSYLWDIPLIPVNHIEGHLHSVFLHPDQSFSKIAFPILCLTVSGGHTEIILMKNHGVYEKIGGTRDDAAGECFDKVAKMLDLSYPGGPKISKLGKDGNPDAIPFPRPMKDTPDFDFSFSGLKTSALYWLRDNKLSAAHINLSALPVGIFAEPQNPPTLEDFCASFEGAIVDVLTHKMLRAIERYQPKTVFLVGGVSANKRLRETLEKKIKQYDEALPLYLTPLPYAMDNAAMIGVAAYWKAKNKNFTSWRDIQANPNWKIT